MEIRSFQHVLLRSAGVLALALGTLAGCGKEEPGKLADAAGRPVPDQVSTNLSIHETASGRKEWVMEAERAYLYDKRNLLEAQIVKVTFFDEQGSVRSVLTAARGKLNRNTDDMEAEGDVVVTGSDATVLRTQSLSWNNRARQILSQDSVTVIRHEDILTGWGFKGDPDLGKFEILRNMRATIRPATPKPEGAGE